MAVTDYKLRFQIESDGAGANRVKSQLEGVEKVMGRIEKQGSGFSDVFRGNLASDAIQRMTGKLMEGGTAIFNYASRLEQAQLSFTSLMRGSAGQASAHIAELQKLSRSTPLDSEAILKMSQRLQGAGIEAQKIVPLIKDIGNTAAATGDLSAERMEGIGVALAQIASKGKVSAEEMEQLAERGIPAWRILSESIGKTAGEARKMAEDGKISSQQLFEAFQKFSRMNFGDAMEKQVDTFSGSMKTIENIALQTATEAFKPIYAEIGKFSSKIAKSLKEQEASAKESGVSFGFAIGEAIGDGISRSRITDSSWWAYILPFGPGGAIYEAANNFGRNLGEGIVKGYSDASDPVQNYGTHLENYKQSLASYQSDYARLQSTLNPQAPATTPGAGTATAPKGGKSPFQLSSQGRALVNAANKLGVSPLDLATIIGFESGGTYSPNKVGGEGNKYRGLIQFGPEEQKRYGVRPGQSFEDQIEKSVVRFFQDRFAGAGRTTAGASLTDLYRTVLGGNPNASLTAKDSFGTSAASGVQKMLRDHRPAALKKFFGGSSANIKGDEWGGSFRQFEDEQRRAFEQRLEMQRDAMMADAEMWQGAADDLIESEQRSSNMRLDIRRAEADYAGEILRAQLRDEELTETEYAERIGQMRIDMLTDERDEVKGLADTEENRHRISQLDLAIAVERLRKEGDIATVIERQAAAARERLDAASEEMRMMDDFIREGIRRTTEAQTVTGGSGIGGGIARGMGVNLVSIFGDQDQMLSDAEFMKNVYADVADFAGGAIGSMVDGLAQLGVQWLLTGDFSAAAALKMLASAAMSIAVQSGFKAIFEYAEASAAAARYDFYAAAMHTTAAKFYLKAALVAGAVGVGAALGARALGGGNGASASGGSSSSSSAGRYDNQQPYTRQSDTAFYSGRDSSNDRLATAIEDFNATVKAVPPGHVFVAGMKANRGAIGRQTLADIRSGAVRGKEFATSMGLGRG